MVTPGILQNLFTVSLTSYFSILLTSLRKKRKIRQIYTFFLTKTKSKEIKIQTTCCQKIKITFMILVILQSIFNQIQNSVSLLTRFFFIIFTYAYSMQYIVYVMIIQQFIHTITRKISHLQNFTLHHVKKVENEIQNLVNIVDIFNTTHKYPIFFLFGNYTVTLISHMYTIHILVCNNTLTRQTIAVYNFFGKSIVILF